MKYMQINPALDTDVLRRAGFAFDGYYYNNPNCPIQFHKTDEGYFPSFTDPNGPPVERVGIKDYSALIRIMANALPIKIGKLMQAKYANQQQANEVLNQKIREYWSFDPELQFTILGGPQGMQIIPNNEYSFSLLNGEILEFDVRYQQVIDKVDQPEAHITIETNPQCICWNYICAVLTEVLGKDADFRVLYVNVVEPESKILVPFFGAGMPRVEFVRK